MEHTEKKAPFKKGATGSIILALFAFFVKEKKQAECG